MTILTERFDEAVAYAREAHASQKRKETEIPYFAHLLGVAAIAIESGASEDQAIAALLHDAVEDQGGAPRLDDIRARFGDAVARIVSDCTDADSDPKPPWRARKETYLGSLEHKAEASLLVSLADKTHNAEAILHDLIIEGEKLWPRFQGGKDGTLWYYRSLAQGFRRRLPGAPAERLARAVMAMHREAGEPLE